MNIKDFNIAANILINCVELAREIDAKKGKHDGHGK